MTELLGVGLTAHREFAHQLGARKVRYQHHVQGFVEKSSGGSAV